MTNSKDYLRQVDISEEQFSFLLTVTTGDEALSIYQIYLKRSRIETVFKFLKKGLGWEEMQVRNFLGIQRLLSFCFFIAAYLYLKF